MMDQQVQRRAFLMTAGAMAAGAVVSACGSSTDPNSGSSSAASTTGPGVGTGSQTTSAAGPGGAVSATPLGGSTAVSGGSELLPTFVAAAGPSPDRPPLAPNMPSAFTSYPASPEAMYTSPPANGGSIAVLKQAFGGAPPTMANNPYWQQLNKRVGATLNFNNVLNASYASKLATTIAGGDLPDIVMMSLAGAAHPSHMPDVLKAKFQDISEFVSGDAIKEYPSLAAVPTLSWRGAIFNGGIYGVPVPKGSQGSDYRIRKDIVDGLGLKLPVDDGEEFLSLCKALSNEKENLWALPTIPLTLDIIGPMVGAPNQWKVVDGQFTSAYATDEYKHALSVLRQLWSSKYIYPDSLTLSPALEAQWFSTGRVRIGVNGYPNWPGWQTAGVAQNPKFELAGLLLPKWDGGGQAKVYSGNGVAYITALKKAEPSRIKELLRVLDWLAAPFGTKEFLFTNFGIAGRDYEMKNGNPVPTPTGTAEVAPLAVSSISRPLAPLYIPGYPEVTLAHYDYLKQLCTETLPLPTAGLVSETEATKGPLINKNINDLITSVAVGRKPLSSWDDGVKAWMNGGGADMTKEYTQAYASAPTHN